MNRRVEKEQLLCENVPQLHTSRLPQFQQTVLAVGANKVLVRVVGDANHILLMDLDGAK